MDPEMLLPLLLPPPQLLPLVGPWHALPQVKLLPLPWPFPGAIRSSSLTIRNRFRGDGTDRLDVERSDF
jgi:hypothetical protein